MGKDKSLKELHSFLAKTTVNSEQGNEHFTFAVVLRCRMCNVGLRCFNMPTGEICWHAIASEINNEMCESSL